MNSFKLECEIITPMFLAGSNIREPELRPPSLKGIMRYWWRAVNGNLPLKDLKEQESNIFGASNEQIGKSKFNIRIQPKKLYAHGYNPILYKRFQFEGFDPGQEISITLTSYHEVGKFEDILKFSLILGGLGRRTRRGFGSLKFSDQEIELENILELINRVGSGQYHIDNNRITLKNKSCFVESYPYLSEVMIGNVYPSWRQLLDKVAKASHKYCNDSLGSAAQCDKQGRQKTDRLSSPLYVSVIKNRNGEYLPIISTLNTVFNKDSTKRANFSVQDKLVQDKFKEMIL